MAVQEEPQRKDKIIRVPARIVLNEAGEQFFRKHAMAMYRFEDSGGARFGFTMKSLDLPWLKKMLLKGFVEKIEIQVFAIAKSNEVLSDAV
ncbi:MAG: hypothetical protein FWG35_00470, partial [Spirochaetaceae bacterium]|nr:hypothetical protein [Spirochaetaceae bacterium]